MLPAEKNVEADLNESKAFGLSSRALIAIGLTLCVCLMSYFGKDVKEPLYSAFLLALGFYFGQKTKGGTNG